LGACGYPLPILHWSNPIWWIKNHQSTTIYQSYQGVHDLVHISLMVKNVEKKKTEKNPVNHGQNPQRKTQKNHISKRALEAAEPNKGVEPPGWGW